jgi:ABC-2 type transport system permease protein
MLSNILLKTLRDERRTLLWWAIGLSALALYVIAVYPFMRDNAALNNLVKSLPPAIQAIYGKTGFGSGPGFLSSALFTTMVPLMFLIYGIAQGAAAVAGEEEKGTLDLLLANPVSRARVVLSKFGAMCLAVLGLGVVLWIALSFGVAVVNMGVEAGNLAAGIASAGLLGIAGGGLALAVGAASGSRGLSIGVSAAAGLAGYLINTLALSIPELSNWQKLSPFYYYGDHAPLINGFSVGNAAVLAGATVVLLGVALAGFIRRDLAV